MNKQEQTFDLGENCTCDNCGNRLCVCKNREIDGSIKSSKQSFIESKYSEFVKKCNTEPKFFGDSMWIKDFLTSSLIEAIDLSRQQEREELIKLISGHLDNMEEFNSDAKYIIGRLRGILKQI